MRLKIVAKKHDAAAKRLAEIVAEFEQLLEDEDMTPSRRARVRRAAELALLAEITRANAITGQATISSVTEIEALAERAKKQAGIYE